MKKELSAFLNIYMEPGEYRDHMLERRGQFVELVDKDGTLREPFVFYSYLISGEEKSVYLLLKWFEIGFESRGIKIWLADGDRLKEVQIPFPAYMWDDEMRGSFKETKFRDFSIPGELKGSNIEFLLWPENKDEMANRKVLELPLDGFCRGAFVSIYRENMIEGEQFEIGVDKKLRVLWKTQADLNVSGPEKLRQAVR